MNLQNVLRDDPTVKRAFVPKLAGISPTTGEVWREDDLKGVLVEFDYSQIEPRLFAYFAAKLGQPQIADMYNAGMDVYTAMAEKTLQVSDVTPKQRQDFKTFFLMILYGAGPKRISETMDMSLKDARAYYKSFHEAWPQARMISNPPPRYPNPDYEPGAIERVLRKRGYIETISGRRLKCGQWEEHKMLNKLIQGSAADVMKRALVRVWKRTKDWPLQAHPILTVHDSILMDALRSELPYLSEKIPLLMDEPLINDTIPVVVEMKWSDTSWADMKEYA